jgi:hypothetical protein
VREENKEKEKVSKKEPEKEQPSEALIKISADNGENRHLQLFKYLVGQAKSFKLQLLTLSTNYCRTYVCFNGVIEPFC